MSLFLLQPVRVTPVPRRRSAISWPRHQRPHLRRPPPPPFRPSRLRALLSRHPPRPCRRSPSSTTSSVPRFPAGSNNPQITSLRGTASYDIPYRVTYCSESSVVVAWSWAFRNVAVQELTGDLYHQTADERQSQVLDPSLCTPSSLHNFLHRCCLRWTH